MRCVVKGLIVLMRSSTLVMMLVFSTFDIASAQAPCPGMYSSTATIKTVPLKVLTTAFEDKLDPENKKQNQMGWGKVESRKVLDFKNKIGGEANYMQLFLPAKFDLLRVEKFDSIAQGDGLVETLRFFGEMLRLMDEKQILKQSKSILEIAENISLGDGFLNYFNTAVTAGTRKFDWSISGGTVSVKITNDVQSDLGW